MKDLLVVLLLASCIIHLNEGYFFKGKRSLMKVCIRDAFVPQQRSTALRNLGNVLTVLFPQEKFTVRCPQKISVPRSVPRFRSDVADFVRV